MVLMMMISAFKVCCDL